MFSTTMTGRIIGVFTFIILLGFGIEGYCGSPDVEQARKLFLQGVGIEKDVPGFTYRFLEEVDPSYFQYYNQYYHKFPVFRGENGKGKVPGTVPPEYPSNPLVLERQTLDRFPDVVGVDGDFMEELLGEKIELLGVFAFRNEVEKFEPIPFQVDEMTEDGRWVLDIGPEANPEDGNGLLDLRDVLSFYVRDVGDRVTPEAWPEEYKKVIELKIVDPLNQKVGWVYLFSFSSPPERSPIQYVLYEYGKPDAMWSLAWSYIQWYEVVYKIGYMGRAWGYGAEDALDTLILDACLDMFFGMASFCLNVHSLRSDIPTYSIGPVLLHRRTYNYIPLGMGLRSPSLISDGWYGDGYCHAPLMLKMPFKLDTVFTSVTMEAGTDFEPIAYGSTAKTSTNQGGFLVDGIMSPEEEQFVSAIDNPNREWRLLSGPGITMVARNMQDEGMIKHAKFELNYIDDITFPKQEIEDHHGRVGYTSQILDLTGLRKGTYVSDTEYYTIPHYKPGDEQAYLNIFDHPLELRIKDRVRENKANRKPPGGD